MDVNTRNNLLVEGTLGEPGLFPHLETLARQPYQFTPDLGLDALPTEAGIISIRGPRQVGKSTWLEQQLQQTVEQFGPGSAFYLNGDELATTDALFTAAAELTASYAKAASVRRLFIDEITAVPNWQQAIKRLADRGYLREVLVVTTGSRARDLRRGVERLPGRKGRLARTDYIFVPISYGEFCRVCGDALPPEDRLPAYMLSGGSPMALAELGSNGFLPEFVVETARDWVHGELAMAKRERGSLQAIVELLFRYGGSAVPQNKLAREGGLANNTVAKGYLDFLEDLLCLVPCYAWDSDKRVPLRRRPPKLHFINLLVATAWHPAGLRRPADWHALPPQVQGQWLEWLVAQELWRRRMRDNNNEPLCHWTDKKREIDFVSPWIEVKRGKTGPLEFAWFAARFPDESLQVLSASTWETDVARSLTLEAWMLELR